MAQRLGFILLLFLFFISGERAEVGGGKESKTEILHVPKVHLHKWPGNRSILMTHSAYLAKHLPWANPLSPSLVQLTKQVLYGNPCRAHRCAGGKPDGKLS